MLIEITKKSSTLCGISAKFERKDENASILKLALSAFLFDEDVNRIRLYFETTDRSKLVIKGINTGKEGFKFSIKNKIKSAFIKINIAHLIFNPKVFDNNQRLKYKVINQNHIEVDMTPLIFI